MVRGRALEWPGWTGGQAARGGAWVASRTARTLCWCRWVRMVRGRVLGWPGWTGGQAARGGAWVACRTARNLGGCRWVRMVRGRGLGWPGWTGGQAARGGAWVASRTARNLCWCRWFAGRCRTVARPVVAIRAGMLISLARMVLVRALVNRPPASTPAALVRLWAMTAHASQAALA